MERIFGGLSESLLKMLNDWLNDVLESIFGFLANILFSTEEIGGVFSNLFNIFIAVGSTLMLAIVLYRVINALLQEGSYGDANIADIVVSTLKASVMIAVLPFMLKLVHSQVVVPLGEHFFKNIANGSADIVTNFFAANFLVTSVISAGGFASFLFFLFLVIVFIVYTFKMCVYHADLMLLNILAIPAAISIATENYDYSETWVREFISQIVSILTQTFLMSAVVWLLANMDTWYKFMLLIGCGVLIIRGPNVLRSMWYSTGGAKAGLNMSKAAVRFKMFARK